ncbi:MAG: hypothetical protein A2176_04115 [Spirochaetes bacterium RBG_13_51_14]|nr:MAG: hypothetical protein A2176_04115 [Spirochaetes bacterium RBG_13_51_14]
MHNKGIIALTCCVALCFGCFAAGNNGLREIPDLAMNITISGMTDGTTYRAYWLDKSLKAEGPVSSNKKNGLWKIFFKGTNGTSVMAEINFKNDLIDGELKEYYPSGRVRTVTDYSNGIMNGRHMTYYESGIGNLEESFRDGKKIGKSLEYFENGNIKENAYFLNDLRNGASTTFYENGKRQAIGRYIDGKKNGPWEHFFENGMLQSKGSYRDDKKIGVWSYYNESGKKVEDEHYD